MRKLIVLLALMVGLSQALYAQRSATSTVKNFNASGGQYSFDIWALRTNPTGSLLVGTSQFFLYYNTSALASPQLSNVNAKYTGTGSVNDYDTMKVAIVLGRVVVTIKFTGNDLGFGQALSTTPPDGELICTVTMTVSDSSQNANLSWDDVNSAITTTNLQPVTNTFVGSDAGPLPITLSSFAAQVNPAGNGVRLDWSTVSEIENYGFFVQRSNANESTFADLPNGFVAGYGTTSKQHTYSYIDKSVVAAGKYYYRLRQQDLDGAVHFSPSVAVDVRRVVAKEDAPVEFRLFQNYPNPFNPDTEIKFSVERSGPASLRVYNVLGQEVATLFNDMAEVGQYYRVKLNGSSLSSGVYFFSLQSEGRSDLKKMLLLK